MTIKKQFESIVELLEANKNCKVSTILPQVLELASGKTKSKTFHKVDDQVIAVYCYYHKQWELVTEVEYGTKNSTASGLSTMCKSGVNLWAKQQRVAKKAKEDLLEAVADGTVPAEELPAKLAEIEEARAAIELNEPGFETLEQAINNI